MQPRSEMGRAIATFSQPTDLGYAPSSRFFFLTKIQKSKNAGGSSCFAQWGFPIRTSPDHRLLATSPTLIAGTPRPSSLLKTKASTIRPYIYPVVDFDNFHYKYNFLPFACTVFYFQDACRSGSSKTLYQPSFVLVKKAKGRLMENLIIGSNPALILQLIPHHIVNPYSLCNSWRRASPMRGCAYSAHARRRQILPQNECGVIYLFANRTSPDGLSSWTNK